jgi:hypothetical protein
MVQGRTLAQARRPGRGAPECPWNHEVVALRLSVVIPALNEERWIEHSVSASLASMRAKRVEGEVIVADGGSGDATRARAERAGAVVVDAPRGRAAQINAAAALAVGDVIAVAHADVLVWPGAVGAIRRAWEEGDAGGWFQVVLAPELGAWPHALWLPLIGRGINWRTRAFSSATGDQLVFARREVWGAVGGAPEVPMLEGWELARRVAAHGRARTHGAHVRVSARRWERGGVWRTMGRMWGVRAAYLSGASPERLAEYWRNHA